MAHFDRRRFLSALGAGVATPYLIGCSDGPPGNRVAGGGTGGTAGGAGMGGRPGGVEGMGVPGVPEFPAPGTAPPVPRRPPSIVRTDSERVFDLSVSSGDPSVSGVILWTHLRPAAYAADTPLWFQVADDPMFRDLVVEGEVPAAALGPARDFTVKVDLEGRLDTGHLYYYRFIYGDTASRTGRCRTLPGIGVSSLKLAVLTCQDYTNGHYGALRHVADDDTIDFIVHLGDFIYESVGDPRFQELPFPSRKIILPSASPVALGLADYRALYRIYRADPALQRALERHTIIASQDDHETSNDCYWDYARDTLGAPDHPYGMGGAMSDPFRLRQLKVDALHAWVDYMPARISIDPEASHPHRYARLYRDFRFGDLVHLNMLDTRSYRTAHPCGEEDRFQRYLPVGCGSKLDSPTQTMLGTNQRAWLRASWFASGAPLWNVVGNQTFFGRMSLVGGATPINVDAWDGYAAERKLLAEDLQRLRLPNRNFVFLTGDLHSYVASEVQVNYGIDLNPFDRSDVVAAEFMTPAVTSSALFEMLKKILGTSNPSLATSLSEGTVQLSNPHIRYFNTVQYGYSTVFFTRNHCEWTAYAVDKALDPAAADRKVVARYRKNAGAPALIEQPVA